jgi:hypothetical protein
MAVDTSKITGAADGLGSALKQGGDAAKTLGSEISNTFQALDARIAALEAGSGGGPPPDLGGGPSGGLISRFNVSVGGYNGITTIDGLDYQANAANKPYAIQKVDDHTVRYEIRAGDRWAHDSAGVDRSELNGGAEGDGLYSKLVPHDVDAKLAYRVMIELGGANTANWFLIGQLHNSDPNTGPWTSPPIAVELVGEKWSIVTRSCRPGGDPTNAPGSDNVLKRPWTAPSNLVRGQWYVIELEWKLNQGNSGYLRVKFDGVQVVNYSGPLGYGMSGYWEIGLYREANSTTMACQIRNMTASWAG